MGKSPFLIIDFSMAKNIQDNKINFAAVEIVNLLGDLDLTPKESLIVVSKVMHFIIEKGFYQSEAATEGLLEKTIGDIAILAAFSKN